ncbi:MAG: hypothetical protein UY48_C0011G0018 [Candidatus Gottesmanbacteria bacterium GW2011_GWB1_49_7]|uniref:Uncharacterized protein n=1 Tax=Candidatus Gottesmanbacteria bacterium GW2011_GWB1_49_7 TaxID=1618448 RepID=A0A0G1W1E7_9BACT|nr:MAG: hypothetical protein UY48_C0011G0018 [Candidatus Gottesmanbacteria bacterium GW2011_GWB1_49_7]
MKSVFGVVHGDLYFHDVIGGKAINPFTRIGVVTNLDESCKRGVVVVYGCQSDMF